MQHYIQYNVESRLKKKLYEFRIILTRIIRIISIFLYFGIIFLYFFIYISEYKNRNVLKYRNVIYVYIPSNSIVIEDKIEKIRMK